MALLRFRIYWEEDDQVYRDIEILSSQNFLDFHNGIVKAYEFDGKHAASFFESNDRWDRGREISSEIAVNKKDAPALSMLKTPVGALISNPGQKFVYLYDRVKEWLFLIELIAVSNDELAPKDLPKCIRKEGLAPIQYQLKGLAGDKLLDVEEKYDLGAADMDGYGDEGEESDSFGEEDAASTGEEDY